MRPEFILLPKASVELYRYREREAACPNPTTSPSLAILFIPGSGGDHEQVRAIAATTHRLGGCSRVHFFSLGVGGMLSAMDGDVLIAKAGLVSQAMQGVVREYARAKLMPPPLALLAHSMGGIAASEAWIAAQPAPLSSSPPSSLFAPPPSSIAASPPLIYTTHRASSDSLMFFNTTITPHPTTTTPSRQMRSSNPNTQPHPHPTPFVAAIVALGTPFQRPPLPISSSLAHLYARHRRFWQSLSEANLTEIAPTFVSICGGCADWQVPTHLCELHGVVPAAALSLSASSRCVGGVGSDHLQLLWCKQIARPLAAALLALAANLALSPLPLPLSSRASILREALLPSPLRKECSAPLTRSPSSRLTTLLPPHATASGGCSTSGSKWPHRLAIGLWLCEEPLSPLMDGSRVLLLVSAVSLATAPGENTCGSLQTTGIPRVKRPIIRSTGIVE
ncbi:MAG: hypothetical protein SGPRY_011072, partial [Prymnesium sp.]